MSLDLRAALNAISDVVNNRPLPLREFDQIYMKFGDLVVHADYVARRQSGRDLVFVGDGDAVGLSVAHLMNEHVLDRGPRSILVLDFDERVVNSINRFAANYEMAGLIEARLYNVVDPLPAELLGRFSGFHINPPWGQHNAGESVAVFLERAVQLLEPGGLGMVVIADDPDRSWTNRVLQRTQQVAIDAGLIVDEMIPGFHQYHLDDAPDLRSCCLVFRRIEAGGLPNSALGGDRLDNFYGRTKALRVHYVRERPGLGRDAAPATSYVLEPIEGGDD